MTGKWIWENTAPQRDEYAQFCEKFRAGGGATYLRISADSNYAAYVNGELAAFGQYADYPYYKVADTVEITRYLRQGENELTVDVWYYGSERSSTYILGEAGLFYEIARDNEVIAASGEETLCRPHPHYVSHVCREISGQLGFGYDYDACAEGTAFHPAIASERAVVLHERPILPLLLEPPVLGRILKNENGVHFLLDLGREEVGFLYLDFTTEEKQTLTVAYGEHIKDGCVRRILGGRKFYTEYTAAPGENRFRAEFRRFGGRYLEIFAERPIRLRGAGLCPTPYPVRTVPFDAGTPRRQAIYDVSVRTLRLCMHEHYEDCPWREQALYVMDSRNQMLAGYYAFGETRFARACLYLMSRSRRDDGLLAITYPCGAEQAIPSFSLHYFTAVLEYTEHAGDPSLAREIWPTLTSLLGVFADRMRDGLIAPFSRRDHWNFYEWSSEKLAGKIGRAEVLPPDLPLNCLFIRACAAMEKLAALTGMPLAPQTERIARMRRAVRAAFLAPEDGTPCFADALDALTDHSELGNALAILAGVPTEEETAAIAERLAARMRDGTENGLIPVTLSMKCFVYDALLTTDRTRFAPDVLTDIERVYGRMLDADATSFWETEDGADAFGGAGSLCHGWSAMPAYYYPVLKDFLQ